ncbi:major facilitator superfamily domain-containing protein [Gongronella butleri]|nr:major facilitator superfamily domain-containing protein [Gongronella butleri]
MTNLTWIGSLWYAMTNWNGWCYMWMCNKIGYKWMLGVGCILSCVSMMLASITNSVWQLYITQGIMNGMASSLVWFPCISAPQQWFSKKRGMAVGMAFAGSGIGGLVLSYVIRASIDSVGYQWSLRIVGFMQLGLIGIAFFTVKPLNPPTQDVPFVDFSPFKNKQFLLLFGIHFIFNFALYIPSAFLPSYATSMGMSTMVATSLSAVLSAVMFCGKIGNGLVSDFFGRANQMVVCLGLTGIFMLTLWLTATSEAQVWAFTIMYGIFGAGSVTTITGIIVEAVGMELVEPATGWLFFAWAFGGLLGQPIAAQIMEADGGSYSGAIIFGGVLFMVDALLALILRQMRSKGKIFVRI